MRAAGKINFSMENNCVSFWSWTSNELSYKAGNKNHRSASMICFGIRNCRHLDVIKEKLKLKPLDSFLRPDAFSPAVCVIYGTHARQGAKHISLVG